MKGIDGKQFTNLELPDKVNDNIYWLMEKSMVLTIGQLANTYLTNAKLQSQDIFSKDSEIEKLNSQLRFLFFPSCGRH